MAMVFFIRKLSFNIMKDNNLVSINDLPVQVATIVDADSYDEYLNEKVINYGACA